MFWSIFSLLCRFALCGILVFFLAACPEGTPPGQWPQFPEKKSSLEDIDAAYATGDLQRTERLAAEFLTDANLPSAQLAQGWRLFSLAATENHHPVEALAALDHWKANAAFLVLPEEWISAWNDAMKQLPVPESIRRAVALTETAGLPGQLVHEARLFLAEQRLRSSGREALSALEKIYAGENPVNKQILEARLFRLLHSLPPAVLANLTGAATDNNDTRYPYGLIRLENARRLFWEPKTRDQARENIHFLREGSLLADQDIFRSWNQPDWQILKRVRVKNPILALVLPLSGQYGNLSEKIVRGAEIVRNGLAQQGKNLQIQVIDSDDPDWLKELAALPAQVKVIGGPLRREDYQNIKDAGLLENRAYFTFLPYLEDMDEGRQAWRFFPSRQDQIRVMLSYALDLGLTQYAIFAPDAGEYGRQMFDLFYDQAEEKELEITRAGYYPAAQYQLWIKSVSDFLGLQPNQPTEPVLDFQAMFLPDNWSNASRIISHVFYCLENQVLFMGTNLWELGLSTQQRLGLRNYRLTIFPGAWDPHTLTPSGIALRSAAALVSKESADFWFSLGYDFALLAASLDLSAASRKIDPEEVNASLTALPPLPWSGAPIHWSAHGLGQQDLFVFVPAENGFVLANQERLHTRLNQPLARPATVTAPRIEAETREGEDHD